MVLWKKKKCIKIIHNLHVLSHKGGSHRPTYKPTPIPLPPPFHLRSLPSPIQGEHTQDTHIHTVIIKTHTHTCTHVHTHTRSTCCHLLYVLSTILIEYIIHFTTIHHITFPQCHSLVLERERERERERQRGREKGREKEREGDMTHILDGERKTENQSKFTLQKVHPENKVRWPKVVSKSCHDSAEVGASEVGHLSPGFKLDPF